MNITKDKTNFGAVVKVNESAVNIFGKKALSTINKAAQYLKDELPNDIFVEITRGYKADNHPSNHIIRVPTEDTEAVLFIAKKIPQNIKEKFLSVFQVRDAGLSSTKNLTEIDLTRAGEAAYENLLKSKSENVFVATAKYFCRQFKDFSWR